MPRLVTLKTFTNEIDMSLVKSLLENEGFRCYVRDEYISQMREISFSLNGGIRLQVEEKQFNDAIKFLIEKEIITDKDVIFDDSEMKLNHFLQAHLLEVIMIFAFLLLISFIILVIVL